MQVGVHGSQFTLPGCAKILGIMTAADGSHLGTLGRSLPVFVLYGLFFWRTFKRNPGNRLIECGSITVIVFLALIPMTAGGSVPGWLFGAWLILTVFLCLATLFFLLQRMRRALARRSG